MTALQPIVLPSSFTYIGVFLTFNCQLRCNYCINFHGDDLLKNRKMSRESWIEGLNRIQTATDLPITLQGGEPTVHKHFYEIVNGIRPETSIELLTNLEINLRRFKEEISPERMRGDNGSTAIRVSYHHGQSNFLELARKVLELKHLGYSIGIWELEHPGYLDDVHRRKELATLMGVDYRTKEFLGPWNGKDYGAMRYKNAVNSVRLSHCNCRTTELLISPDGSIYRCHSDLYAGREPIGHILDENPPALGEWRSCAVYGRCNSCDIKIKPADHFRTPGQASVEIKDISEPYADNNRVVDVVNTYGKK